MMMPAQEIQIWVSAGWRARGLGRRIDDVVVGALDQEKATWLRSPVA